MFNVAARRTRRESDALSTSRVDSLIGLIRNIDNGIPQEGRPELISRKVLPRDYKALLRRLESSDNDISGFFHSALRYEYRPSLSGRTQLTIRMNCPLHEGMIADINRCMGRELDRIIGNAQREYTSKAVEVAGNIDFTGGRVLKVGEKDLRADCSYKYKSSKTNGPGLLVEVAWSQSTKTLRNKAREFIHGTEGNIRTIVGLDFSGTFDTWNKIREQWDRTGTLQRGPARIFVWRSVFDRKTGKASLDEEGQPKITESTHVFCNEDGEANMHESVHLTLQDIVPESVIREENINRERDLGGAELVIDSPTFLRCFDNKLRDQKDYDDSIQSEKDLEEATKNDKKEESKCST